MMCFSAVRRMIWTSKAFVLPLCLSTTSIAQEYIGLWAERNAWPTYCCAGLIKRFTRWGNMLIPDYRLRE